MPYSVMYISSGVPDLNNNDVHAIMDAAHKNNHALNISGFLLYDKGNFLQLLEGDQEKVMMIYDRVKNDWRHRNLIPVMDQYTEIKGFDFYHSGFKICDNPSLVNDLKNYVAMINKIDTPEIKKTANLVQAILEAMNT